MAGRRSNRAITIYTTGSRGNSQYGLSEKVGRVVKRVDSAKKIAAQKAAKIAPRVCAQAVKTAYGIDEASLNGKYTAKATAETITILASTRKFSLVEFSGKWRGRKSPGATAAIIAAKNKTYQSAFISPGRLRGTERGLIYKRIGPKVVQSYGRYKGKKRQGIVHLRGPSPYQMLLDPAEKSGDVRGTAIRVISEVYIAELKKEYGKTK